MTSRQRTGRPLVVEVVPFDLDLPRGPRSYVAFYRSAVAEQANRIEIGWRDRGLPALLFHRIPSRGLRLLRAEWSAAYSVLLRSVALALRSFRYLPRAHVVVAHGPYLAAMLAAWTGRSKRRPRLIYLKHSTGLATTELMVNYRARREGPVARLLLRIERFALRRVDLIGVVSHAVASDLENLQPGLVTPIRVLTPGCSFAGAGAPGATEIRARLDLPAQSVAIASVGTLAPDKGFRHLLKALAQLIDLDWCLWVVGSGPDARKLKQLGLDLGIGKRVRWLGQQSPATPYVAAADLFVHPSLRESFGIVVMEAMSLGKAVVATRTGGTPELVGEAGILVAPGSPEALAPALRLLIENPALREELGRRAAREIAARYSPDALRRGYCDALGL